MLNHRFGISKRKLVGGFDPSILVGTLFASKTDGNDADDGLTEATAKETLDPGIEAIDSANAVVGLYYGDEWLEQYDPALNEISLIPYGTPANGLPIISGMDVITGWTLVAAMTNAYEKSVAHTIGNAASYNFIMVAEIDESTEGASPYSSYFFLRRVADVATCESTPGSYHCANALSSPNTVTIHPSDSGNPNSNGKRYEVTTREFCVENYAQSNLVLYKLILKLSGDGYGQVGAGQDSWVQQCLFLGSGTHAMVMKDGTVDQCVFVDGPRGIGQYLLTFYQVDPTGRSAVLKNSVFHSDWGTPLYVHSSALADVYDSLTITNCRLYQDNSATGLSTSSEVNNLTIENCYITGGAWGIYIGATNVTFKNCIVKDVDQFLWAQHPNNPTQELIFENCLIITDDASSGASGPNVFNRSNVNCDITVRNCTIYAKSTYSGAQSVGITVFRNSDTNLTNCYKTIIIADVDASKFTLIVTANQDSSPPQMVNGEFEDNVYILLSGGAQDGINWLGSNPSTGYIGFQSWKEKSGQDQNSLYYDFAGMGLTLDDLFVDPSNGDWRLANTAYTSGIRSLGSGMTTPNSSYPSTPTIEQSVSDMLDGSLTTDTLPFSVNADYTPADNWISAGSFSSGQEAILRTFVANLLIGIDHSTNVWDALVLLDLYIWGDATNNGINGRSPGFINPVFIGSPTHGASGISLNATSQYIQLGVTADDFFLPYEITLSTWLETNQDSNFTMGARASNFEVVELKAKISGDIRLDCYNISTGQGRLSVPISDSSELLTVCRRGGAEAEAYRNGTSLGTSSVSGAGAQTIPSLEFYSGGRNNASVIQYSSADVKRLDMVARKMSDEQVKDWNAAVQQLMTDLGI